MLVIRQDAQKRGAIVSKFGYASNGQSGSLDGICESGDLFKFQVQSRARSSRLECHLQLCIYFETVKL